MPHVRLQKAAANCGDNRRESNRRPDQRGRDRPRRVLGGEKATDHRRHRRHGDRDTDTLVRRLHHRPLRVRWRQHIAKDRTQRHLAHSCHAADNAHNPVQRLQMRIMLLYFCVLHRSKSASRRQLHNEGGQLVAHDDLVARKLVFKRRPPACLTQLPDVSHNVRHYHDKRQHHTNGVILEDVRVGAGLLKQLQ
ncbi:ferric reductase transmembrane protein-like protein [Leishmania tarentolae]|uniref:Ferric reductase transmembrane protein-like protein n=1 Tax=Leishmania tarentolae TaxID=5689 RepID=A0A640KTE0_LEITA|nr:ferric reductase transmembrane protein-like protein [Leishmania tarentolae]